MENKKITNRSSRYEKETEKETEIKEEIKSVEKKEQPLISKIIITIIIVFVILLAYSTIIGNKILEVKEYKIESSLLPDSFHGLKIIQLSDIHYGTSVNKKQLKKIIDKVNELNPDIIFFTGDLIDSSVSINDDTKNYIIEQLNSLNPTLYKYAIYGDQDINNEHFIDIMEQTGFKLLANEKTLLYYKDSVPISITGFNSSKDDTDYSIFVKQIDEQEPYPIYNIVLTHKPDTSDDILLNKPNLILSGHTLGGLINIGKPLILKEGSKKYYNDYYRIDDTEIFISNGLGTSNLNARFNNHPSINFYRLYKTN